MFAYSTLLTLALSTLSVFAAPTVDLSTIEARQSCSDVYVYFARGTTETGTLGSVVGPGLSTDVTRALSGRSVRVIGIDYPANVAGYLAGGDTGGAKTMADSVTSIANSCPNAKLPSPDIGAQVTHLAAARLSSAIQNRVNAVVTFGDPYERQSLPGVLQGRRKTFCATGDLICAGLPIILTPHLGYGADTDEAADFIASRV